MKIIKITAAILVAAFIITGLCSCREDRSGYMTNNCTKDGVDELLAETPELGEQGFAANTCYNITPDGFDGVKLYKSSENGHTVIKYPNYSAVLLDGSDKPGLINAVLCDLEGIGRYDDVLYTYADGTTKEYGIGVYNYTFGAHAVIFKSVGEMYPYLVKQEADDGMPDVFSVLAVTVTQFKDNPADLGCVALGSLGTVTVSDGVPVFSIDSGEKVNISEFFFDGIKRIIVSTIDGKKTYTDEADIKRIAEFVEKTESELTDDTPPKDSVTYIIAAVYENGGVAYVYINDGGFIKFHGDRLGDKWQRIKGELQLPF